MKIETVISFPHLLWGWCKKVGFKRVLKYGFFYALYVAIVKTFDYLYIPWLAIKFRYFAMIPLYFSLFIVSWLGLLLYRSFKEDMLFVEGITFWLNNENSSGVLLPKIKEKIRGNPKKTFIAISTWWSPIHAYLYFERDKRGGFWEASRTFAIGSFYCALFWGVIIDALVFFWDMFSLWTLELPLWF